MTICHVWDGDYPWDVRVEKVSQALTDAGHDVHIVARNRRGLGREERLAEATVHRLKRLPGAWLNRVTSFPAFFNPRWLSRIHHVARKEGADVILVRDLPLAPTAIRVGRRLGLPVVLDMAENYPAMISALWETGQQKALDVVVRNPRFVKAVENWVLPRVDHILVVVQESGDRLVGLGVPRDRVTVVSNTPPLSRLASTPRVYNGEGPLQLFYIGLLEAPRGIAELIQAVAATIQGGVKVELHLVGDGRGRDSFHALARRLGLLDTVVHFHGYLPYAEGLAVMARADVGVVPHHANESWNTTIPNKLFDYMAAGLAVLTSPARPAARIVQETGAGLVFQDRDPADAARAISLLADVQTRRRLGNAGRKAIETHYHWEKDAERLKGAIRHLKGHDPSRTTFVVQGNPSTGRARD